MNFNVEIKFSVIEIEGAVRILSDSPTVKHLPELYVYLTSLYRPFKAMHYWLHYTLMGLLTQLNSLTVLNSMVVVLVFSQAYTATPPGPATLCHLGPVKLLVRN